MTTNTKPSLDKDWISAPPMRADAATGTARLHLRWEDISQDGRLLLEVLPAALGPTIWGAQLANDPLALACRDAGIVPILTRYVIEGDPGPFSVVTPMNATGRFALAQTSDGHVMLNMWAEVTAPIGRTYPPAPAGEGTVVTAGRIFAEHVFTRLFAPPGKRRVSLADLPSGVTPSPLPRYTPRPFASLVDTVEDQTIADDSPFVFGLVHTDSNQHVNSLAYLRLFEEAALRRLAATAGPKLARRLEIAYRKPCFAGDRMRIHVRASTDAATVAIAPDGAPPATAHAIARMILA